MYSVKKTFVWTVKRRARFSIQRIDGEQKCSTRGGGTVVERLRDKGRDEVPQERTVINSVAPTTLVTNESPVISRPLGNEPENRCYRR